MILRDYHVNYKLFRKEKRGKHDDHLKLVVFKDPSRFWKKFSLKTLVSSTYVDS